MTQAMVLVGVLAVCAVSGALLAYRHRWTPGPDEPIGSSVVPAPPAPSPEPSAAAPSRPPAPVALPVKPAQPLPTDVAAAAPVPAQSEVSPVRRSRNSGCHRFTPAAPNPVGRITPRVYR